jgi:hypothetical protein
MLADMDTQPLPCGNPFTRSLIGFIFGVIFLCGVNGVSAHPVEGVYWMLVDGDGKLEATVEKGELQVRVVAIKPKERNMRDSKNPDEALRDQRVLGMVVMKGFHWNEKQEHWEGGTIYDPTDGASYRAFIWSEDGNLKVRGYRLIGWFGRTETFEPVKDKSAHPELVQLK